MCLVVVPLGNWIDAKSPRFLSWAWKAYLSSQWKLSIEECPRNLLRTWFKREICGPSSWVLRTLCPLHLQGARWFMHLSCPSIRCLGLEVIWLQGSSFLTYFMSVHLLGHNSLKCAWIMPSGVVQPWCYAKHLTKFSRLQRNSSPAFGGSPVDSCGHESGKWRQY